MKLIIMRHGEASWASATDFDRPLTERGQQEVAKTADALLKKLAIDQVLASPYLRAQQTGQVVTERFNCPLTTLKSLTPDGQPQKVIEQLPEQGTILLASHMPMVGRLTGLLCDGVTHSGPEFCTAQAIILNMEFPAAGLASVLEWVNPE